MAKQVTNSNQLSRLVLKGYKSIAECDLPLGSINVLIGANGAGKSNFIGFFKLIGRILDEQLQVFVGDAGGQVILVVAELGLQALSWTEGLRQWQARVESLRRWMPELGLPDCSDVALLANRAQWLQPAPGHRLEDHLYVVDPLGHWMLRFPADIDPTRAKRDLDRLLRASSAWDQPGRGVGGHPGG